MMQLISFFSFFSDGARGRPSRNGEGVSGLKGGGLASGLAWDAGSFNIGTGHTGTGPSPLSLRMKMNIKLGLSFPFFIILLLLAVFVAPAASAAIAPVSGNDWTKVATVAGLTSDPVTYSTNYTINSGLNLVVVK